MTGSGSGWARAARAAALLSCLLTVGPTAASELAGPRHTYRWVRPHLELDVAEGRRTTRIREALERVPDCLQERMNLIGAHLVIMGRRAPADHQLRARVDRDFFASGWRALAAPFVRMQGRAYPLERIAFVRRGGRGALARSPLFTRWIPLTGRGEQTALHEYGHLVAFALALDSTTGFLRLWAHHSPNPVADLLSPRGEIVQRQEWFARAFTLYFGSDTTREQLDDETRAFFEDLERRVHRGVHDARFLEFARLAPDSFYLGAARELGLSLLPARLAAELREMGAWGLGFHGQLWYTIQSTVQRDEHGAVIDRLLRQRDRLVANGALRSAGEIHVQETCGDVSGSPICEVVRRNRSRVELWHPCLGPPVRGCLVSFGPSTALLEDTAAPAYPWLAPERHREIAFGRLRLRVEVSSARPERPPT